MRSSLLAVLLVAGSACGPRELKVTLNSDNNSGQSGFAVITDLGGKQGIAVYVETSAPEYREPQLAHIHTGTCGEIGNQRGMLEALAASPENPDRFVSTTRPVPDLLTSQAFTFDLLKEGEWAINVHDAREVPLYVSCGEIPHP